jgi:hypothetical protein
MYLSLSLHTNGRRLVLAPGEIGGQKDKKMKYSNDDLNDPKFWESLAEAFLGFAPQPVLVLPVWSQEGTMLHGRN